MFGVVTAVDLAPWGRVGVKMISETYGTAESAAELARFRAEAEVMAGFYQPNVLRVLATAFGRAEGRFAIVMPLMEMGLRQALDNNVQSGPLRFQADYMAALGLSVDEQ